MKELWIRSQDRLRLVKTTDICIDYNNQKSLIANCRNLSNGNDDYFPLGEYDTEERALEVLDEIQATIILGGLPIYEMKDELSKINIDLKDKALFNTKTNVSLYIMPQNRK